MVRNEEKCCPLNMTAVLMNSPELGLLARPAEGRANIQSAFLKTLSYKKKRKRGQKVMGYLHRGNEPTQAKLKYNGRFTGDSSWVGSLVPRNEIREVTIGRETGEGGGRQRGEGRERENVSK